MPLDDRARALLDALNELTLHDWVCHPGSKFYAYRLTIDWPGREQFQYDRHIEPRCINGEPFRTALRFTDEASERLGRYLLLKPENDDG